MSSQSAAPVRTDGYVTLDQFIALGDGRYVALSATDGCIDWWCAPNMDSPPLFDRVLSADKGGYFSISPREAFTTEGHYLPNSNVACTTFKTATGSVKLTESMNSSNQRWASSLGRTRAPAGRFGW